MANYYLSGYSTPDGVESREDVKQYQRMLGVTADGIWGPVTQAAYRNYTANTANPFSNGSDVFKNYYDSILGTISTPGVSVSVPSRDEIAADYETILRPSVDLAIKNRRKRGETALAEIDADAASRGMTASTYVSSMKEREDDDVEDDVTTLEAQYTSSLAERIAFALEYYTSLEMQAASTNAQAASSARSTAASIAAQWYQNYLNSLANAQAATGSGSGSGSGLAPDDYLEYVSLLSASERDALFNSGAAYWTARRKEIIGALGKKSYDALVKSYDTSMRIPEGTSGGGTWLMSIV